MKIYKKIGRNGSISIPASLRRDFGIEGGERVEISVDSKGVFAIKRILGACIFCKSDQGVTVYGGRYICKSCVEQIKKI